MARPRSVDDLVTQGRLERVPADAARAAMHLAAARSNLAAARQLHDPAIRYKLAYDAGFEAVLAHLAARGVRLRSKPGHHEAAALYAALALTAAAAVAAADDLDTLRRGRNAIFYQAADVGDDTAAWAADTANTLIDHITIELAPGNP